MSDVQQGELKLRLFKSECVDGGGQSIIFNFQLPALSKESVISAKKTHNFAVCLQFEMLDFTGAIDGNLMYTQTRELTFYISECVDFGRSE